MRFDLLDEYSTLVPFGLGVSRKTASQYPAVLPATAKASAIAKFASCLQLLVKMLGTIRPKRSARHRRHSELGDSIDQLATRSLNF